MCDTIKQHKLICNELNEIYAKKNHDYGNSFDETFQKLGIISAITRMSDKLNRLCALSKDNNIYVHDESIEDTLKDLANYAIMTLISIENQQTPECTNNSQY